MNLQISQRMYLKYINAVCVLPPHNPTATANWIQNQSGLPWLTLDIGVPNQTISQEINNIKSLFTEHREDYNQHQGWSSFCIHGKSYDATREDSYYNDNRPYNWTTQAQQLMPKTVEYFQHWPGSDFKRIRVMQLAPGGYITIHNDYEEPGLKPINIAITQPDNCDFVMAKHGRVPFGDGKAMLLDVSNHHVVFNNSNQTRWHIIIHQSFDNIDFENLVVKSYNMLYNKHNEAMHNTN